MHDLIPLLFDATDGKSAIYRRMCATGRYEAGRLVRKVYGDKEIGHFIQPDLKPQGAHPSLKGTLIGREVVIVGDLRSNELIMDTYDVCNNAFDETARKITLVLPKSSLPEDAFRRRALLELFAAVPQTPSGNKLVIAEDDYVGTPSYTVVKPVRHVTRTAYDCFGNHSKPILLYTSSYQYMAHAMARFGDFEIGRFETEELDGKPFFKRLLTNVHGRRVIIVTGSIDARETVEHYYMARAVALAGAAACETIKCFFNYGTMERKTKSGEAVKAKIRARMLSSLPSCPFGNRIIFVDLHADGIPYYLEGGKQPHHSYVGKHLIAAVARELGGLPAPYDLGLIDLGVPPEASPRAVLGATDLGRSKWVKSMGEDTKLATAYGLKERVGDDEVKFVGAQGDVFKRLLLLYDDKCGTGGTAIKSACGIRVDQYGGADALESAAALDRKAQVEWFNSLGAKTVLAVSHFVGDAAIVQKLREAKDPLGFPLFEYVVASDSHPVAYELSTNPATAGFFRVKSIAPLLVKAVSE